jgi:hypothetical protein
VLFLTEIAPGGRSEVAASLDRFQLRGDETGRIVSRVAVDDAGEDFTMVHSFAYPRRKKTMRLSLSIREQWHDWEMPNPLYGSTFPEWSAEPFPQTKKDGDFAFTATGWIDSVHGWTLDGKATYRGRAVDHEFYVNETADATGNVSVPELMPDGERAWKIEAIVRMGDNEPITPDRLVEFGDAVVPGDGEHVILPVPPQMLDGQQTFIALVGKGRFAFRNGVYSSADLPEVKPKLDYPYFLHSVDTDGWVVRGEVLEPTFVMLEISDRKGPKFASESLQLSCFFQDGKRQLNNDVGRSIRGGRPTKLSRSKLRVSSGTPVRIRSVRPEGFRWELIVPPISAAERERAREKRKHSPAAGSAPGNGD